VKEEELKPLLEKLKKEGVLVSGVFKREGKRFVELKEEE